MFDAATAELLESGCALIVGFVTAEGLPFASRGWGLNLFDGGARARLLVASEDLPRLGHASGTPVGTTLAVTGCNVRTLRSVQVKGRLTAVEAVTESDRERKARYCAEYFDDVAAVDAIPRSLMEQLVPDVVVACEFEIEETYDQTPGPGAGAALQAEAS